MIKTILSRLGLIALLVVASVFSFIPTPAKAASNNARMMDDVVFDNAGTMSSNDIQNFLNQFPNSCIKNYYDEYPNDYYSYGGNVSAAQAIRRVSDIWGINPRVILTKLEQEENLVSGSGGCSLYRYVSAVGFDCPGPTRQANFRGTNLTTCVQHDQNMGFSRQITKGAWLLKWAKERANDNFGWSNDDPNIYYYGAFVNAGNHKRCGSCGTIYHDGTFQGVDIITGATAAFYNYTPFLNQSFDDIYTGWFGSPYTEVNETNINWNFEPLDGSGSSVSGQDGAFGQQPKAISFNNSIQVFYYDATNGNLKRAYESGSGWQFETLDGAGGGNGRIDANVGKMPSVSVYGNALHVFYYDVTNGDLRHGVSDSSGSNWTFETLDGAGGAASRENSNLGVNPTSTVLGSSLQLFYYSATNGNLRHAWYDTSWHFENLDGDPGSVGHANADLGEDPEVKTFNNNLQLFYYDISNGNLRHAWTDSSGWHFENLDGDPGSIAHANANLGRQPAVEIFNNNLQLFYYDISNGNLRHAWTNSTGWNFENLDGDPGSVFHHDANLGLTPAVTSKNGVLYVFYYDQQNGVLRSGYSDNTGWHRANLDGDYTSVSRRYGNSGIDPTAIQYNGNLQLYYYDFSTNDLRHAWGPTP